jgi:hypothetical protein
MRRLWRALVASCCSHCRYRRLQRLDVEDEDLELIQAAPVPAHLIATIGPATTLYHYFHARIQQAKGMQPDPGHVSVSWNDITLAVGYSPPFRFVELAAGAVAGTQQANVFEIRQGNVDVVFEWRREDVDLLQQGLAVPVGVIQA